MKFRNLRIAWSLIWAVVALLLLILWVRSYSARSTFEVLVTPTHRYNIHSLAGTVAFDWEEREFITIELRRYFDDLYFLHLKTNAGLKFQRSESDRAIYAISVSYWLLVIVTMCISAIPWLPLRFSLRTMLVGITLLAVALGLIMRS
jgi:hypothetical protein